MDGDLFRMGHPHAPHEPVSRTVPAGLRIGILCLPLAGLLLFVGAFVRGPFYSPAYVADAARYGAWLASGRFLAGWVVIIASQAFLLAGTVALGLRLQQTKDRPLAQLGQWLAVVGLVLQLAGACAIAAGWPAFGREIAAGNADALERLRARIVSTTQLAA